MTEAVISPYQLILDKLSDNLRTAVETIIKNNTFEGITSIPEIKLTPPSEKVAKKIQDDFIFATSNICFLLSSQINAKNKQAKTQNQTDKDKNIAPAQIANLIQQQWEQLFSDNEKADEEKIALQALPSGHLNFCSKKWVSELHKEREREQAEKEKKKETEKKEKEQKEGPKYQKHEFTVTIAKASFSNEKFELFKKYQTLVHKDEPDEVTESGFQRFLINNPFPPESELGTYHHEYRIDGKLFAVGVIDLLPTSLSAVYLFYDTDYNFLAPGKLTALKEIEYVQNRQRSHESFKYYVMGFYIHSCKKMKYKGQYQPSELLCPITKTWVPLEICLQVLDVKPYGKFNPNIEAGEFLKEREKKTDGKNSIFSFFTKKK
jgi:arginine-tRNA-protein transferase